MNLQGCLTILQLDANASLDDIKTSFRKLAFKYHPDLNSSPNASEQFQKINEAYVTAKTLLDNGAETTGSASSGKSRERSWQTTREKPRASRSHTTKASAHTQQEWTKGRPKKRKGSARSRAQRYYYKEEEVLKDILNDPFAKKVFEDIYRQIRKEQPGYQGPLELNKKHLQLHWGERTLNLNLSRGIKGWFKGQMDHEQTVHFPAQHLLPGRKIRITVEQKFTQGPKTIEVTLPQDFVIGRPIRLKGLGRKLGPLTGDLLLRILGK
ncbi:DnaJ domain-containing protein [Pseudodesulfovibrio sp. JC047]|uniref:J domain-containing protein n=1 Tax=Pseudodesulfovibrio sp. JC047 TaxID=2683199 RepID=UPI0013D5D25C|nr:J domain-containing protein [Pseudodesulfovibrio sp. JC047]NDV20609.1 DnaJ domain-containing protein [Pseudodesulfovibrio sp. JC047]